MATAPASFLFVDCNAPTTQKSRQLRRQKNRHAQLAAKGSAVRTESEPALPVTIRSRIAKDAAGGTSHVGLPTDATTQDGDGFPHRASTKTDLPARVPGHGRNFILGGSRCPGCKQLHQACRCRERISALAQCMAILRPAPGSRPFNPLDQKALSYFYDFAAVDLSVYLPGRFWDRLVLQISDTEPLVRQAVVAVSNAHLNYCTINAASTTSLASHQSAIERLREYMQNEADPSREVVNLCCILFFAFSRITQDPEAASVHLQSGMSVLRNARHSTCETAGASVSTAPNGQDALRELSIMFVQLDIETMLDIERGPVLNLDADLVQETYTKINWNPQMTFCSPHEAMEPWMACRRKLSHNEHHTKRIADWRYATKSCVHNHPVILDHELPRSSQSQHRGREVIDAINALTIESHHFSCKRFIAESLQDPHTPRPFDWKPEKLLRTAKRVIALRKTYHCMYGIQPRQIFSTHVGITEALLLLTHRTTSLSIRKEAQGLIQQCQTSQGGLIQLFCRIRSSSIGFCPGCQWRKSYDGANVAH